MVQIYALGMACSTVSLFGFYAAYLYGRKIKRFRWSEYFAIISIPLASVFVLAAFVDWNLLKLFGASMVVGTTFEYLFGFVYEKTLNVKLWTYHRFALHGHTSLLSIPVWGIAGVVFWALGKCLGL